MASFLEYCENMSTEQLQALLREEYRGCGNLPIPAILDVCSVLSTRDPSKPSVELLLRQLCGQYL